MKLEFGKVLDHLNEGDHENFMGLSLLSLASIAYHREELHKFYYEIPNHPFSALRTLYHKELLDGLSKLITIEKLNKMQAPTGIHPHTHMLKSLCKVINFKAEPQAENKEILKNSYKASKVGIDDAVAESGHLTV